MTQQADLENTELELEIRLALESTKAVDFLASVVVDQQASTSDRVSAAIGLLEMARVYFERNP